APYIGDGSPADQYMWVDNLTLATGRISSAPSGSVASITVGPASASVVVGGTSQFTATLKDASGSVLTGQPVTWASSNTAVATVSESGLVSGVAAGSATISATSGEVTGTAAVTVTAPVAPVASVAVSPATASVAVGQTVQLIATPKDASGSVLTGRAVTWTSNTPAVATVSGSGLVTGVGAGAATITATSEAQSGTAAITGTAPVTATAPGAVADLAV